MYRLDAQLERIMSREILKLKRILKWFSNYWSSQYVQSRFIRVHAACVYKLKLLRLDLLAKLSLFGTKKQDYDDDDDDDVETLMITLQLRFSFIALCLVFYILSIFMQEVK